MSRSSARVCDCARRPRVGLPLHVFNIGCGQGFFSTPLVKVVSDIVPAGNVFGGAVLLHLAPFDGARWSPAPQRVSRASFYTKG